MQFMNLFLHFFSDTSYGAKFMTTYGKKTKLGKRIKTLQHNMHMKEIKKMAGKTLIKRCKSKMRLKKSQHYLMSRTDLSDAEIFLEVN